MVIKLFRSDIKLNFQVEYFLMEIIRKDTCLEKVEAVKLCLDWRLLLLLPLALLLWLLLTCLIAFTLSEPLCWVCED